MCVYVRIVSSKPGELQLKTWRPTAQNLETFVQNKFPKYIPFGSHFEHLPELHFLRMSLLKHQFLKSARGPIREHSRAIPSLHPPLGIENY